MIAERVLNGERTYFTRWGDGEWDCIFFQGLKNCDGHQYYYDLAYILKSIVEEDVVAPRFHGLQKKGKDKYYYPIMNLCKPKAWVEADEFHHMSEAGDFKDWLKAVQSKYRTVMVGPEHLKKVCPEYINVPDKVAWLEFDRILADCRAKIKKNDVVFFCAGLTAKVLINELSHNDDALMLLDLGSVFEPYVGKQTRNYHRRVKV